MADQHDLAEQLLGLAIDDERALGAMVDVPAVTDAIVGFHAQQAVEKALKSVLAAHGVDFPFAHDLRVLMDLCDAAGVPLPPALADARRLTPYAVAQRYGTSDAGDVTRSEAAAWAADAIAWARPLLEQSRPRE
jgi:HEPN domain-containing protein